MSEQMKIGVLHPDEKNLRRKPDADKEAFKQLVASIKAVGIVEPLIVRARSAGGYEIVAGHRRFAAATDAGLSVLPVEVRALTDQDVIEYQLIENLQRVDLDPVEEASGYFRLVEMGMNVKTLSSRIGRSSKHVSERLKLLELPAKVLALVKSSSLSVGAASQLLPFVEDPEVMAVALAAAAGHDDVSWKVGRFTAERTRLAKVESAVEKAKKSCSRVALGSSYQLKADETTKLWRPLGDFDLTPEQLKIHVESDLHALAVDPMRATITAYTTSGPATRKLLGLGSSLSEAELESRRARRLAKEAAKLRKEALIAATGGKLPKQDLMLEMAMVTMLDLLPDADAKGALELLGLAITGTSYRPAQAALGKFAGASAVNKWRVLYAIGLFRADRVSSWTGETSKPWNAKDKKAWYAFMDEVVRYVPTEAEAEWVASLGK